MRLMDLAVLGSFAVGSVLMVRHLRRSGLHGRTLSLVAVVAASGLLMVVSMAAHTIDVFARLYAGTGHDGAAWSYDFRVYSMLLLGFLLGACGARLIRLAPRLAGRGGAERMEAVRVTLVVLAIVLPLLPVHGFFAVPATLVAALNLAVLLLLHRGAPAVAAGAEAAVHSDAADAVVPAVGGLPS
jgi:hypothetical protein